MISIEGVPEPGVRLDPFEDGLLLPIPGQQPNSIVLEDRDGTNVDRLAAKSLELSINGKRAIQLTDARIDLFVTNSRIAVACSKYDKGGGWFGDPVSMVVLNAGSKMRAAVRRRGKMLVGQVRYPWMQAVGCTSKEGWLSDEELVFDAKSGSDLLRLQIILPKSSDAAVVAASITRRAALYRLASDPEGLGEAERARLQELTIARPLPYVRNTSPREIRFFRMPTYWHVNEKSARFVPRGAIGPDEAGAPASPVSPTAGTAEAVSRRCPNRACDAAGIPTRIARCDVCGRVTAPMPPPPPPRPRIVSIARPEGGVAGMTHRCKNSACDAVGVPTWQELCDVCGRETAMVPSARHPIEAHPPLDQQRPGRHCAQCGGATSSDARFCRSCGAAVQQTPKEVESVGWGQGESSDADVGSRRIPPPPPVAGTRRETLEG